MKPVLVILLLFFRFTPLQSAQADIINDLANNFKDGDAKQIAKNFSNSVELIVIDQEDVYSKAQSEQIIKDFFVKNTPTKVAILHTLSNNPNYKLGILSLTTRNGKFRVTITMNLRKPANIYQITELRIEADKQ